MQFVGSMEVRAYTLYSAFLLAVVELDSLGALKWIVERIGGSIPHFFSPSRLCFTKSCARCLVWCDAICYACAVGDLTVVEHLDRQSG